MAILRVKDEQGNIIEIPAIKGDKGDKGEKGDKGDSTYIDVLVNGASIVDKDGNAVIPIANYTDLGVVKPNMNNGVMVNTKGELYLGVGANGDIDSRTAKTRVITTSNYDYAVKCAMTDGKGAEWTSEEKVMARNRLGLDLEPITIDIETAEEIRQIDIDNYNGNPLSDYDFKQMWIMMHTVGNGSGATSEVQVRLNEKKGTELCYLGSPTGALNNIQPVYWGGHFDLRNGLCLSNGSQSVLSHYRVPLQSPHNSYTLLYEENINKVTIQSISTVIPIGTKFKIVLR